MAIEIHFRRDPKFTSGPKNTAWADVDGVRYEIPPNKRGGNNGGAIYRLIVELCDAGYEGEEFTAHDGRVRCLQGTLAIMAVRQPSTGRLRAVRRARHAPRAYSSKVRRRNCPEPARSATIPTAIVLMPH